TRRGRPGPLRRGAAAAVPYPARAVAGEAFREHAVVLRGATTRGEPERRPGPAAGRALTGSRLGRERLPGVEARLARARLLLEPRDGRLESGDLRGPTAHDPRGRPSEAERHDQRERPQQQRCHLALLTSSDVSGRVSSKRGRDLAREQLKRADHVL